MTDVLVVAELLDRKNRKTTLSAIAQLAGARLSR